LFRRPAFLHDSGDYDLIVSVCEVAKVLRSVRDFARKEWPFGPSG